MNLLIENQILQLTQWKSAESKFEKVGLDLVVSVGSQKVTISNCFSIENLNWATGQVAGEPPSGFVERIVFGDTALRIDEVFASMYDSIRDQLPTLKTSFERVGLFTFGMKYREEVFSLESIIQIIGGSTKISGYSIPQTTVRVESFAGVKVGLQSYGINIADFSKYGIKFYLERDLISVFQKTSEGEKVIGIGSGILGGDNQGSSLSGWLDSAFAVGQSVVKDTSNWAFGQYMGYKYVQDWVGGDVLKGQKVNFGIGAMMACIQTACEGQKYAEASAKIAEAYGLDASVISSDEVSIKLNSLFNGIAASVLGMGLGPVGSLLLIR